MIKLTKIDKSENFQYDAAPSVESYRNSLDGDQYSPNIDYWIIGEYINPPVVGKSVVVSRHSRNGIVTPGVFVSSIVTAITESGFTTNNSVYKVEEVDDTEIPVIK